MARRGPPPGPAEDPPCRWISCEARSTERLFSLEELQALSSDLLGFSPGEIGGAASKASFARALADRCFELDAVEALVDAVVASRTEVDQRVKDLGQKGLGRVEELKAGETFGPFTITKKLGEGPRGIVYLATKEGAPRRRSRSSGIEGYGARRERPGRGTSPEVPPRREGVAREPPFRRRGRDGRRPRLRRVRADRRPAAQRPDLAHGASPLERGARDLEGASSPASAPFTRSASPTARSSSRTSSSRAAKGNAPRPILIDAGGDRLSGPGANGVSAPWGTVAAIKGQSPEVLRGKTADAASDLYGFGALLFEVLTGKPVFAGDAAVDVAVAHLTKEAPRQAPPRRAVGSTRRSTISPRSCSRRRPARAPRTCAPSSTPSSPPRRAVRDPEARVHWRRRRAQRQGRRTARRSLRRAGRALALESTLAQGADPVKVAEAFTMAADQVEAGEDEGSKIKAIEFKKSLLFRAARLYEHTLKDGGERAEQHPRDGGRSSTRAARRRVRSARGDPAPARQVRGARRDAPRPQREERESHS